MNDKGATRPAAGDRTATLDTPRSSASAADHTPAPPPFEHHWSVLGAIVLIVAAVIWSLLRQRRRN